MGAMHRRSGTLAACAVAVCVALAVACSSTPRPTPSGGGESACGDGYLAATNGACPKGFCLEPDAGSGCCGSQCATCEDEGLVSTDEGGACPPGTCVSSNLTVALTCCDACPGDDDAGDGSSGGEAGPADAGPTGDAPAADAADAASSG
jgi:hypothetical protein